MAGKVLGGCRCDPETATFIYYVNGVTLYRTKSRRFFTEQDGRLHLLTDDEAAAWIREHADETTLARAFDIAAMVHVTADLPEWLVSKLDAVRGRKSRRAVIQAALEQYLDIR